MRIKIGLHLLLLLGSATCFLSPQFQQKRKETTTKFYSTASTSSTTGTTKKRKKSVLDRSQKEFLELLQEVSQVARDAGPRAGIVRTLTAINAFSSTFREFVPRDLNTLRNTVNELNSSLLSNSGNLDSFVSNSIDEKQAAKILRTLFERLGATYIKLGQFIASSPTLFPEAYVLEFQKCLDKTEALPWSVVQQVIKNELGAPLSKHFSYIDKTPLASASIAQVHTARLKDTGEEVVIKVQKPNIGEVLKADLSFIFVASRILEFLQPDFERTSIAGIASDIRSSMLEELDFEKESQNLVEFREFLTNGQLLKVATAPRVYPEYTTKKVLTMERLRGVSLLDADSIKNYTNDPEKVIITALNIWTTSVMEMPWFHADVHAGNLLVCEDGRVGFIDFGIVGRVSPKTFSAVTELSTALAAGDYEGMAQALTNMGATDEDVDIQKFGQDIERVLRGLSQVQPEVTISASTDGSVTGTVGFDEEDITRTLLDIVNVTEDNGLKLPREFGLLVKQSLYFDRYLKVLAPDLNVMEDSRVNIGELPNKLSPNEVIVDV